MAKKFSCELIKNCVKTPVPGPTSIIGVTLSISNKEFTMFSAIV